MASTASILEATAFVEAHLCEPVTVEDMATAAGYSLFYFSRVFNESTGHSPYDYLIRRRLSEAAQDILDPSLPLSEVAYRYQFGSPDTFTRAFRRMLGLPPSEIRKRGSLPRLWLRSIITDDYIRLVRKLSDQAPLHRRIEAVELVGTEWAWGADDWTPGRPERQPAGLPAFSGPLFHTLIDGESLFVGVQAGVSELPAPASPFPLTTRRQPAQEWVGFRHHGSWVELLMLAEYINQSWLPGLGVDPGSPQALILTTSDPQGWCTEASGDTCVSAAAGRVEAVMDGEILAPLGATPLPSPPE